MTSGRRWLGNSTGYAVMIEMLMDGPYTLDELVKLSGMAETTAWKFVKALHRRQRAYIAVWRTDKAGRYTRPAYRLGQAPDVPRPAPKSNAFRGRQYRKRLALEPMTRSYDAASGDAPQQDAESKNVEEEAQEPSA